MRASLAGAGVLERVFHDVLADDGLNDGLVYKRVEHEGMGRMTEPAFCPASRKNTRWSICRAI